MNLENHEYSQALILSLFFNLFYQKSQQMKPKIDFFVFWFPRKMKQNMTFVPKINDLSILFVALSLTLSGVHLYHYSRFFMGM